MGDLTYLIIFLVVINIVGKIFRTLQKSAARQAPKPKPGEKRKDPFSVLAERLEELREATNQLDPEKEPLPRPYTVTPAEMTGPELAEAELPTDFEPETRPTSEAAFEQKPRPRLHEESFPYQKTDYGYKPPLSPVTPAPIPERGIQHSYRAGVLKMLGDPEHVRNAVLLGMILGPCRAREGRYRFRGPR